MVAIVAGAGLGLGQTSAKSLGGQGVLGYASKGYLGSNFLVNASTGNLIIQNMDEVLQGLGRIPSSRAPTTARGCSTTTTATTGERVRSVRSVA
jgi:hypothetical protein